MNKNFSRIIIGTLLGAVLLTALMILLQTNTLLWVAYIWSIWALTVFAIALGFWATGSKLKYVLFSVYPKIVTSYLICTLLIALFFSVLSYAEFWTISWRWFCLIEFAVLAVTAWKLQALDAGTDKILAVEEKIKVNTVNWEMLLADISIVVDKTADADKKNVVRTMETIRFADPIGHSAVVEIEKSIKNKISELGIAVTASDSEKIHTLCTEIENLVKERSTKLMILK